jgi:hypothetical protein
MTLLIAFLLLSHMGLLNGITAPAVFLLWLLHLVARTSNSR